MLEAAKGVHDRATRLLASPRAMLLPQEVRELLHTLTLLNVEMAGRIENLERKDHEGQPKPEA